ncbi:MAG: 4Fe-4S binding protein [Planctomycetes bacterium]|nr:4Fe-4S binding protein [Planctomycetota bacterium]
MSRDGRAACAHPVPPPRPARGVAPELVRRGELAPSGVSKWRAGVLIAIHVFAALHIAHWQSRGETVSPLEPSEAMYTVADGAINAGVILLGLALLSTAVLGRWFCGWACHLVAVQDFCAHLLRKIGIRPRPLRSRVLMWIPLFAGLYLFGWPAILRFWRGAAAPELHLELTKSGFWDTFPGWGVALFTFFVCGVAAVYFLGSKGFCTYACPYGGLFALVEPLSPLRIRVTDACKQCGHCSATCTSNVDVASEVHRFGMVVDPGCMKCSDCVSVCPENALYWSPGKPAVLARPRVRKPYAKVRHYSIGEELLMLAVFLASLAVLHGLPELPYPELAWLYEDVQLYARMPLLLALALSGLAAFTLVHWLRLVRRAPAEQSFQDRPLLDANRRFTRAGRIALAVTSALLLLLAHAAWVQLHMFAGGRSFHATAPLGNAPWQQSPLNPLALTPALRAALQDSEAHLARAEQLSLLPDVRIPARRAWIALCRGDLAGAQTHLAHAIEREPSWPKLHHERARLFLLQGELAAAERSAREASALDKHYAPSRYLLAGLQMQRGAPQEAAATLRELIAKNPRALEARAQLVTCLEVAEQPRAAELEALLTAVREAPDAPAAAELRAAELLLQSSAVRTAIELLERFAAAHPRERRAAELLAAAYGMAGDAARAAEWERRVREMR